ncbi:hypothetical protein EDB92DRAFT_823068 [Lactarius akahatsu]|uniref:F-box domain-containing protein n=1 Tax=Lactarius akahatsu TaxID=416441 RepID=A0AAD4Q4M7_9AGAM|nr:hypothetical protein EDB92DRAFT_823068 [Lactarius akahatsu]
MTLSTLNYDVLLKIFDWYRLYNTTDENQIDQGWNLERWWYRPIHVCRKCQLILSSPTRLDLHLVCTYGIPVETMLSHSPPLPIIIYYPEITGRIPAADDEESALFALQHRERVRRIHVAAPTAILCNLFKVMDNEFPVLENLTLHSSTESRTGSMLPEKLEAPSLHQLTLSNIALPIQSPLLRQAEGLITLRLWNVPASPEFHPAHLVAQLSGMSHLEVLMIHFFVAIPNHEVERRLRSIAQLTQIALPSLKIFAFRGGSAYLEGILARLSAPLLSTLNVEFFNQLTFHLSHLRGFVPTIGEFRFRSAEMHFDKDFVSVIVDPHPERVGTYPLLLQVRCQPLGWQATCAVQICHALEPFFAGVDSLTLGFYKDGPASWQDEIDHAQWHGLLRTVAGVKSLQVTSFLL